MPFYDYQCGNCGHVHEFPHKMTDTPRVRCPECGHDCDRLIGVPNVGLGKSDREIWNYSDIRSDPPVWLKSKDGKTRVRYDSNKHGLRKGGESWRGKPKRKQGGK